MRIISNTSVILIAMGLAAVSSTSHAEIPSIDERVAEGRALAKERKFTEAGDKFKEACDKKVGEGCYYLANAVRDYRYPPATLDSHYALKQKSCDLKFAQGCSSLGLDYRYGSSGLEIDKAKGNALVEKACKLGWGSGCDTRASDYKYGFNDTPKDPVKAFTYLKKSCDAKQPSAEGCKNLAVAYNAGKDTPRDLALALVAIEKAYNLNPEDREIHSVARTLLAERDAQAQAQ